MVASFGLTGNPVPDNHDLLNLLSDLDLPGDLARLDEEQLTELADAIRRYLVTVMSQTGGHLSPNLGVVELTIALHRVFSSPEDAIIWDVGHQAYVHKILTGRREQFDGLRQFGGISGFLTRTESEHDQFGAGHAGTSISAAHGMAVARDLKGGSNHVVAIIGDGALTAGMAFEALNSIGHLRTRVIVVLNDNGMSISPNVGALSACSTPRASTTSPVLRSLPSRGWSKRSAPLARTASCTVSPRRCSTGCQPATWPRRPRDASSRA